MTLAEAQRQAQIALEHVRTLIEHGIEDTDDLDALEQAEAERDIAWLTACTGPLTEPSKPSQPSATPPSTLS